MRQLLGSWPNAYSEPEVAVYHPCQLLPKPAKRGPLVSRYGGAEVAKSRRSYLVMIFDTFRKSKNQDINNRFYLRDDYVICEFSIISLNASFAKDSNNENSFRGNFCIDACERLLGLGE